MKFPHDVEYLLLVSDLATVGIGGFKHYLKFFSYCNVIFKVKSRLAIRSSLTSEIFAFLSNHVNFTARMDLNEPVTDSNALIPLIKKLKVEDLHVNLRNCELPPYVEGVSQLIMTNQGIHFSQLPYLLQRAIIGKFSLQRFADFEQCSRVSMLIYKEHISIKFPHEVDYLLLKDQFATVGIGVISWYLEFFANVLFRVKTRLTVKPPIVPALLTFLRTNVIESKRLDVNEPIRYPNDLIPILKKLKVEELHVTLNNNDEVPAYLHGVSEVHFYGDHYIILEEVLFLKTERVTVTLDCVTLDPIVAFVQEWLDGCVDFKEKTIFFCERSFQPDEMHDALESIGKYSKVKLKKEIVDYFVFKRDEDNFPLILVIYSDLIDFFVGDPDLYEFCDY